MFLRDGIATQSDRLFRSGASRSRSSARGAKPVAVFRFLSKDWSPWTTLVRMRERWPELRFEMKLDICRWGNERKCAGAR